MARGWLVAYDIFGSIALVVLFDSYVRNSCLNWVPWNLYCCPGMWTVCNASLTVFGCSLPLRILYPNVDFWAVNFFTALSICLPVVKSNPSVVCRSWLSFCGILTLSLHSMRYCCRVSRSCDFGLFFPATCASWCIFFVFGPWCCMSFVMFAIYSFLYCVLSILSVYFWSFIFGNPFG